MSEETHDLDVLLVQRAAIGGYPPVLNQAAILAEAGFEVGVLDGSRSNERPVGLNNVTYLQPLVGVKSGTSLPARASVEVAFVAAVMGATRRWQPRVCILFDVPAILTMPFVRGPSVRIVHFHEYPERIAHEGGDIRKSLAKRLARRADVVVVPDHWRAGALFREAALPRPPEVLMNCPRRLDALPSGMLRAMLPQRCAWWRHVVLFQGSISETYYLEEVLRSMTWWPEQTGFVCVGPDFGGMGERLRAIANQMRLEDRLLVLPRVPYSELLALTVEADVSVTTVRPKTFNFTCIAGASNKRFEAMACGVPQVTNRGPGVSELIERTGCGVCVDPEDVAGLGTCIADLLRDPDRRTAMSAAGREAHLTYYNYEQQFTPMLKRLRKLF